MQLLPRETPSHECDQHDRGRQREIWSEHKRPAAADQIDSIGADQHHPDGEQKLGHEPRQSATNQHSERVQHALVGKNSKPQKVNLAAKKWPLRNTRVGRKKLLVRVAERAFVLF